MKYFASQCAENMCTQKKLQNESVIRIDSIVNTRQNTDDAIHKKTCEQYMKLYQIKTYK